MDVDFKRRDGTLIPVNQNHMDSSSESAFIGSWGSSSSSSFLTTSFGSELDSNDTDLENGGDEDEFIAELTRQMADYMLEENDEVGGGDGEGDIDPRRKPNFQDPVCNQNHEQIRRSYADTVKKSIVGFQPDKSFSGEKQIQPPPTQLYQAENQPRVWGRRGMMSESTHQLKPQVHGNRGGRGGGEFVNGGKGFAGVHGSSGGMRAIFLGGSGSRNGSSGTGVFLPRSAIDATDQSRKKQGCSTVLIPTRVLQALEQHFNKMESRSPTNNVSQTHLNQHVTMGGTQAQSQESVSVDDHQKSKLPQEWIY